ncbi:MAG: hypothetical protein AB9842_13475 [Bacteroidales bacterium]
MIRYLRHKEIDASKWDHCISHSVNGIVYAYSWYLDTVCDQWDALVEGDYDRVFPLTYRKKLGIRYLYQPCFSQQLGIFSNSHLTPSITDNFLDHVPPQFKLIEIQLNSYNEPAHAGFSIRMRPNLELDLILPYEELSKSYSQNLKRNLKAAGEEEWNINKENHITDIITLFRENRGKNIETLTEDDYRRLQILCTECLRRQSLIVLTATDKKRNLHAGVMFIKSQHRIILLFSANDAYAREKGAMPLLIDRLIQEHSNSSYILDFEGSENPNLARFYASFGAKQFNYPFIHRDILPWYIKLVRKIL